LLRYRSASRSGLSWLCQRGNINWSRYPSIKQNKHNSLVAPLAGHVYCTGSEGIVIPPSTERNEKRSADSGIIVQCT
jgi:hypothetical protein